MFILFQLCSDYRHLVRTGSAGCRAAVFVLWRVYQSLIKFLIFLIIQLTYMFSNRLPGRFDAQCHKGQLKRGMIGNQCLIDALVTAHA